MVLWQVSPSLSPVCGSVSMTNDWCSGVCKDVAGTRKCVSNESASADTRCAHTAAEICAG